ADDSSDGETSENEARFPVKQFLTLKGKSASVEMEKNIEAFKDRGKSERENQAPNLDLSLLPAWKAVEPQKSLLDVSPSTNGNAFRPTFTQSKNQPGHNQLTIFYKGTINVYNVTPDLAKAIMLAANNNNSALCPTPSTCHTSYIQPALTPKT
ncbi:hypothetical protein KI387_003109, partial [Taxus chinensis]